MALFHNNGVYNTEFCILTFVSVTGEFSPLPNHVTNQGFHDCGDRLKNFYGLELLLPFYSLAKYSTVVAML